MGSGAEESSTKEGTRRVGVASFQSSIRESASSDSSLTLLKRILASDAPEDVYSAVLEALEEMEDGAGIPALIDAARSHPNREVRADALRRLAVSDDPRAQRIFEQTLRRP